MSKFLIDLYFVSSGLKDIYQTQRHSYTHTHSLTHRHTHTHTQPSGLTDMFFMSNLPVVRHTETLLAPSLEDTEVNIFIGLKRLKKEEEKHI